MFNELLINPVTKLALEAYKQQPPHALLFVGAEGMGKLTLANTWAYWVTAQAPHIVSPDERGTITIEVVRELYRTVRGKHRERQIILIDHAETMSLEAENAFLKLLEEPRDGVTFILTTPHVDALLPTTRSRSQQITIHPVTASALQAFALQNPTQLTPTELTQLLFIARGRPAIFARLLANRDELQEARNTMQQAKELLVAKPYDRFRFASKFGSDREICNRTLEAMLHMASLQIKKSTDKKQLSQWLSLSNSLESALQALAHNGNVRAQLLKLFVSY